jgi:hypothetical protein
MEFNALLSITYVWTGVVELSLGKRRAQTKVISSWEDENVTTGFLVYYLWASRRLIKF